MSAQQQVLVHQGMSAAQAHSHVLSSLYSWIQQNSFVQGMDDTFMISTILMAIALFLTLFYGSKAQRA